jgi:hypothetical protein
VADAIQQYIRQMVEAGRMPGQTIDERTGEVAISKPGVT